MIEQLWVNFEKYGAYQVAKHHTLSEEGQGTMWKVRSLSREGQGAKKMVHRVHRREALRLWVNDGGSMWLEGLCLRYLKELNLYVEGESVIWA